VNRQLAQSCVRKRKADQNGTKEFKGKINSMMEITRAIAPRPIEINECSQPKKRRHWREGGQGCPSNGIAKIRSGIGVARARSASWVGYRIEGPSHFLACISGNSKTKKLVHYLPLRIASVYQSKEVNSSQQPTGMVEGK